MVFGFVWARVNFDWNSWYGVTEYVTINVNSKCLFTSVKEGNGNGTIASAAASGSRDLKEGSFIFVYTLLLASFSLHTRTYIHFHKASFNASNVSVFVHLQHPHLNQQSLCIMKNVWTILEHHVSCKQPQNMTTIFGFSWENLPHFSYHWLNIKVTIQSDWLFVVLITTALSMTE